VVAFLHSFPAGGSVVDVFAVSEHWQNDYVVVTCGGELDLATADQLTDVVARVVLRPPRRVVIDLTAVTFMGSSGLTVLVAAHNQLGAERLRVVAASPALLRLFHLTRLDEVFVVLPQLDAALS
jgi:anti-sigma B factor antagonist